MTRANKPGTERHRDEARAGGGPRMHGVKWHDDRQAHRVDHVRGRVRPPIEAGEEHQGMGKHIGRNEKGSTRMSIASHRGKGKPGIKSR